MIITVLLVLVLLLSLLTVLNANLLVGVIALSGVSLISALPFYLLNAPDVAITEAAVGAGLSTIAYLWVLRSVKTAKREPHEDS